MLRHLAYKAGIQPHRYWQCSLDEVLEMLQAYEARQSDTWQHTREIAWLVYAANTDPKERKDKTEIWPLPGDEKTESENMGNHIERWKKMGLI